MKKTTLLRKLCTTSGYSFNLLVIIFNANWTLSGWINFGLYETFDTRTRIVFMTFNNINENFTRKGCWVIPSKSYNSTIRIESITFNEVGRNWSQTFMATNYISQFAFQFWSSYLETQKIFVFLYFRSEILAKIVRILRADSEDPNLLWKYPSNSFLIHQNSQLDYNVLGITSNRNYLPKIFSAKINQS